jgi:hypothetical protein
MRLEIVKNFLSPSELSTLNEWAQVGVANKWLDLGMGAVVGDSAFTDKRLTSRFYSDRYRYSAEVLDIANRVRSYCGVANYPIVDSDGRDGIVVSYTIDGGDVPPHRDGRKRETLALLRCNILTQVPDSGGVLHVDGSPVELAAGDLHCYLASEHEHYVTPVSGDTPRILWMFGAQVDAGAWNSGQIVVGA